MREAAGAVEAEGFEAAVAEHFEDLRVFLGGGGLVREGWGWEEGGADGGGGGKVVGVRAYLGLLL